MGAFTVSAERVQELGVSAKLEHFLFGAELVPVSGVLAEKTDAPRLQAVLDTVHASYRAGLQHLIMLDSSSHPDVEAMITKVGGVVVRIDHDTEGGLARPFVIASQLIDAYAPPSAVMVKFEGEKPVFDGVQGRDNLPILRDAGKRFDITTGVRTADTWESMPPFQVATEVPLGAAISDILDVSDDTPSGVIVLSASGRRLFQEVTSKNDWTYLIEMPYRGKRALLEVGDVPVDFRYHPFVVREEKGSPEFDRKRLRQMEVMLNGAIAVVGQESLCPNDRKIIRRLNLLKGGLSKLATPEPAVCPL